MLLGVLEVLGWVETPRVMKLFLADENRDGRNTLNFGLSSELSEP